MDKEAMARALPEHPPQGLVEWLCRFHGNELGGEFCIFHSERIRFPGGGRGWSAECTCTACEEDFITRKEPGVDGICLIRGEDNQCYTLEPWEPVDPYMGIEVNRTGDAMECPLCGNQVNVVHRGKIGKSGKVKRIMALSVQNVGGYTALIYWMVHRRLTEYGISTYGATPEDAYIIKETGGLQRFTHVDRHGAFYGCNNAPLPNWKPLTGSRDIGSSVYPDWGSIMNRKQGYYIWPEYPDQEGTTGEKTGLLEYLRAGGGSPISYLKLWRPYRCLENLCRQGQAGLVEQIIRQAWVYSYSNDMEAKKYLDLTKQKPHEILGISKGAFRRIRAEKKELTLHDLELWREYRRTGGGMEFHSFLTMSRSTGYVNMKTALELVCTDGVGLEKLQRYLNKCGGGLRDAGILKDTRRALRELYGRDLTQEELWPRRLHDAHDRAHRMLMEKKQEKEANRLLLGFQTVLERYGTLQWTDGELCMVLPKNNGELVREGDVLRHCVGSYGNSHIDGSSVIFFVRHYRRPERPYYTLAINMKNRPRENQLHGYGNERHGPNKEYTHTIPKKVRAFCDRWEEEILLPWYLKEKKKHKEEIA